MISKNVKEYVCLTWGEPQKTITEVSAIGEDKPLVESSQKIYCFDDICKDIFMAGYVPTSADGLLFSRRRVNFIEFKSGFKDIISTENFCESKAACDYMVAAGSEKPICESYWDQRKRVRELEKKDLLNSIRLKAIETFATLEHHILPNCPALEGKQHFVKFTVVIDAEEVSAIQDIYADLANQQSGITNIHQSIRDSLKRLKKQKDKNGNFYYYDEIEVIPASLFMEQLK